jgi:hypothetical protein
LVSAKKLPTPEGVDLGFVGEVDNIDTSVIDASLNAIPVIAPIGIGADECFYNINADLVAGSSVLPICGPPPCTTIGFMPTDFINTTSRAKLDFSFSSIIALPPYLITMVLSLNF